MESGLDTARIKAHFVNGAMRAADIAARAGLEHIRSHAPVRHLFRGTTHTTSGPLAAGKISRFATPNAAGFTSPHQTGVLAVQRSINFREETGRVTSVRNRETAELSETSRRIGHANSEIPVLRVRKGNLTIRLSGDFRAVGVTAKPVATVQAKGGKIKVATPEQAQKLSESFVRTTARGNFEIKSGRARFTDPNLNRNPRQIERVGGRLKGELRVIPATLVGGHVWAYVESPTVDPKTGYPYPRAQEFGSAHNRPHPFMRPGLHETRAELVNAVKQNVRAGSQR